jgi:ketoreductase RED2
VGRLEGKVAVITGSSSGIGEVTARLFDAEGASLVVNSRSSATAGERLASSLREALYVQADVGTAQGCEEIVGGAVERFGRIDVLVNNAGVTKVITHRDLDAVDDDLFRRILEVNVIGPFRLIRLAMPYLRASGDASVVNVSSVAGSRPTGSSVPYAVSKAALNHLTALLANVTGPEVRVNAVAPGLIRTPWTEDWTELHESMSSRAPLRRSGSAAEVAEVILDVATSRYVTGQVVAVDGGFSLR